MATRTVWRVAIARQTTPAPTNLRIRAGNACAYRGRERVSSESASQGKWIRMLDVWQLLQLPLVIVVGIVCVSGHLLATTVAGNVIAEVE